MWDELTKDPVLFFIYFLIAMVVIANVFVSGYWLGRTHQILDDIRPAQAEATASPR
jgi:hypothetical protein